MRLGCCSIYKDGSDCTNGGASSAANRCMVIWNETVSQIREKMPVDTLEYPVFVLVNGHVKNSIRAITLNQFFSEQEGGGKWAMFGGNFLWTCDSRFPTDSPIKIHDRYEG